MIYCGKFRRKIHMKITNNSIQKQKERGNVGELCDKSIYEMSHCKHFEKYGEWKSQTWFACVNKFISFLFPIFLCHVEVLSHNLRRERDRGRRKTNKIFCVSFSRVLSGFMRVNVMRFLYVCDFCVLNLFVRMINDFMAFPMWRVIIFVHALCCMAEFYHQEKWLVF